MNDESKVFLDAQTTTLARAATSPRVAAGRFRMRLLCSASGTGKTATRAGITGCGGSKTIPRSAIGTMLCSKMKCRSKGARGSLSSFFLQRSRRYLAPAHSFQGPAWPSHPTGTLLGFGFGLRLRYLQVASEATWRPLWDHGHRYFSAFISDFGWTI